MSNYRRKSKPKTEHIKKGFTVFQKTIATLASILGLITASITIMNALDKNKKETPSQTTTIIKEVQKESSGENNNPTQNQNKGQEVTQKEEAQTTETKANTNSDEKSSKTEQNETSPSNNQAVDTKSEASNGAS